MFVLSASIITPTPVDHRLPTSYVNKVVQFGRGDETKHFEAFLCGGAYFDGLTAKVALNLLSNPWSYERGRCFLEMIDI